MPKKKFRKVSLAKLRSVSPRSRYVIDKKINNALYRIIKNRKSKMVMLYIPLAIEVNIIPLIQRLRAEGIIVLVPFMEDKSFRLVKYRLPLKTKKYGVKEPNNSIQFRKREIDLAVVPIVGTDISFRRIGFGKGMYDRFFMQEDKWINEIIFTQRLLCWSAELITDDYDVGADGIITA